LWRVHSDALEPGQFNPTIPTRFSGGRFDSPDGRYAYLYAGSDTIAAVAETLLRDRPPSGAFLVPRKRVEGKRSSRLSRVRELSIVVLHGSGLTAIHQTAELTSLGPADYAACRAWARALRADAPAACGFEWRPRHDNDRFAYLFFADRCSSILRSETEEPSTHGFEREHRRRAGPRRSSGEDGSCSPVVDRKLARSSC
jgi:hypothetical protein